MCLSATVSNAEELADWIATVRGPTAAVIEERRPVELREPLPRRRPGLAGRSTCCPTLVDGRPNPEAEPPRRRGAPTLRGRREGGRAGGFFTPRRRRGRRAAAGRGDAAGHLLHLQPGGLRRRRATPASTPGCGSPTPDERDRIRAIVEERTAALADDDLDVLGYDRWLAGLEAGVAAHHAGMVPPFKEAVEACFAEGLVKVVFATETLALGINMPARSVVIEKLTKFTGERHEFLTPGEYTQLTGRAGRRGIDEVGHAVVLWSPFVPFEQVAGAGVAAAPSRSRSSFRPTYNMAANLVRRYAPEQAHHLLNLSFAQYQADRAVVRLEARLERQQERLARLRGRGRAASGATSRSTGACVPRPASGRAPPNGYRRASVERTNAA